MHRSPNLIGVHPFTFIASTTCTCASPLVDCSVVLFNCLCSAILLPLSLPSTIGEELWSHRVPAAWCGYPLHSGRTRQHCPCWVGQTCVCYWITPCRGGSEVVGHLYHLAGACASQLCFHITHPHPTLYHSPSPHITSHPHPMSLTISPYYITHHLPILHHLPSPSPHITSHTCATHLLLGPHQVQ